MKQVIFLMLLVLGMIGCSKKDEIPDYSEIAGYWKYKGNLSDKKISLRISKEGKFELDVDFDNYYIMDRKFNGNFSKKENSIMYVFEIEGGRRHPSDLPAKGDIFELYFDKEDNELSFSYDGADIRSYENLKLVYKY
ncbi:hypothetical protein CAPN004_10140 [Capnocytophaga cynodegmi]|uniref:hypothetical protein n=1 Tax=Capnocytophaga cynodegmi TaxID=28189 RepID=UPI001AC8D0AE|nr:hypothetical protein [Capnocytophaga cynodegmi]GIM51984.1 hypothetical protein CAPN004_10140 [Capnocytophaga cynodegmi]